VLKAACEGRLVPTEAEIARQEGREYEPASVLLERIKAEREAAPASGRGKRGPTHRRPGSGQGQLSLTVDGGTAPTEGGAELPEGWAWSSWENLADRVTVGHVGPMKSEYVSDGIPFLRSQNVRENRFDPKGLLYISSDFHQRLSKSTLKPDDLVVVRSGSVGVTCVIPEPIGEANCADLVIIQRPHSILPKYGAYFMNSIAKRAVRAGQVGVALIHFNTKSVAKMSIAVPPMAEQERIVAEVDLRLSLIDQMELTVEVNLKRAESLRQSILRRAFSGRLVARDATS
jgi:type I restriction enzyme S subunit